MLRDTKSKMKKGEMGRGLGHVTYFSNFGPLIFLKRLSWKYKPQILHVDWR